MVLEVNGVLVPRSKNEIEFFDSGTDIYLQSATVRAIYAQIPGSGYDKKQDLWFVPRGGKYPTVNFSIGGEKYQIPSHKPKESAYLGDGTYYGQYQSLTDSDNPEILGSVFLSYVLAVHDFANKQIGFARRKDIHYD